MMDGPATVAAARAHLERLASLLSEISGHTVRLDDATRALDYAGALFTFCPFAPGDTVQMIDPPVVTAADAWGWMAWRHLFVAGERCIVRHLDWRPDAGFVLAFEFERETWIDSDGDAHPVSRPGLFHLAARRFAAVTTP
jgi:hypothetical protein